MFWKVLLHASQDEGLDLILLFPDQMEVMNLPGTIEALKHLISKTLENFVSISTFYRHLGDFLFSQLPVFLWKWPWMGRSAWLRGWGNTENDEEQVSRTDLASKDSVLHTVEIIPGNNDVECITYCFLSFPVITIAVTYRCMLQCLGEQCIKWWKATKLKLCGQRKRSLHHRSSPSDSPASDQGKHQGYLTGCSTAWVLKKQSEWTSGRGIYGKMLNRLNEISYEVQMTLLKLYLLENQQ